MTTRKQRVIVMLGMHPSSKVRGGISSVVDIYRNYGLFARWPIVYIGTVASGTRLSKIGIVAVAMWRYLGIVSSGRLELLHAHTSSRGSLWRKFMFILIAIAARRPVVLHLHSGEFDAYYHERCGPMRKWLVRLVFSRADRVVVLSQHMKDVIGRIHPAARTIRIYNPVAAPIEKFAPSGKLDNVLLFLGVLSRKKGIFDLLEALVIVRSRIPSIRLRCGGNGDVAGVEARARELGVDDCLEILGWVSGSEKRRVLSEATIYVLPSYAEGLPMGVLEAMAAGTPVVATAVGGVPDAVADGVDGFLVAPGDTNALAERILRLLDSSELRSAFATAALGKVRDQFSADNVLSQVEALYESLGATPHKLPENKRRLRGRRRTHDGAPA
jgi:glycosyltransferase involved in cell wall biosynthesis